MFVSSAIDVVEGIVRVSLSVVTVVLDLEAAGVRLLQADADLVFLAEEVVPREEVVFEEDDVVVGFVDEEDVAEEVVPEEVFSDEEAVFDDVELWVELSVELSVDSWDSDLLLRFSSSLSFFFFLSFSSMSFQAFPALVTSSIKLSIVLILSSGSFSGSSGISLLICFNPFLMQGARSPAALSTALVASLTVELPIFAAVFAAFLTALPKPSRKPLFRDPEQEDLDSSALFVLIQLSILGTMSSSTWCLYFFLDSFFL